MSTVTRNLSNIDGANVTNPDANSFTANGLPAYANDAAFEAVTPAFTGAIYWNTTDKALRQYNGTAWQYDKTIMSVQVDAASTGSGQDITPNTVDQVIRFTSGTLASIRSLVAGNQKTVFLVNDQAINLTIQNQVAGATAANRIITGTGGDIVVRAGRTVGLVYDEDATRWRVTFSDFAAGALQSFANDAAYETATPAIAGAIYWNTTEQCLRQYNGSTWQYDKTMYATATDNTTTGSNQDITPTASQVVRFTEGSLASIRSIAAGLQTAINFVNGQASQNITIVNESAGATAANRIVTGTGTDFVLKPGALVGFVYDSVGQRWRLASGGGGGGLQPTAKTASFAAEAGNNYLTDTSGGAIVATLPAGTDGATIRFVDATESWGTNNLTITPASGQIIDMLAADETLVCDVVRGWVELSWNGSRWAFSSLASTTVGEASASSPGIVSIGTQSFAGLKTFNDGFKADDDPSQSTLNYYREDDSSMAAVTFRGDLGGANSAGVNIKITRIGRIVTLEIPAFTGVTPTTNSTALVSNTNLPTWARPSASKSVNASVHNNATWQTVPGNFFVTTGGQIQVYRDILGTAYTNSALAGWYHTQITYTV